MAAAFAHKTVLLAEATDLLRVMPGGRYCDATIGGGGHALKILAESAPDGLLIGLDRDPAALRAAKTRLEAFGERLTLQRANFADVLPTLQSLNILPIDGIIIDVGVSSHQIDSAERGFSFTADGPLDMRMDPEAETTAQALIGELSEAELAQVLRDFGEERKSKRIARAIKKAMQAGGLDSTLKLANVVADALGPQYNRRRPGGKRPIHPATRTFQALRIAVNDELGALDRFLETFIDALRPGGRVVVISFHSLEDRAVKRRLVEMANPCICPPDFPVCACGRKPSLKLLTRRPVRPSETETAENPRARSARLRAAERI